MKRLLAIILISGIIFSACNPKKAGEALKDAVAKAEDTDKTKEVRVKQYSLRVPDYMEVNMKLHPDASLQYANIFKEMYVIVIDETTGSLDTAFASNDAIDQYRDSTLFGTY